MIGQFPHFTPLTLELKDEIRAVTDQFDPYSDFNFTSLFSWDVNDTAAVAMLNGNLVVKLPHYVTGEPCVSVLGDNKMDETLDILLGQYPMLEFVPEAVLIGIKNTSLYKTEEDRSNHDYIYDIADVHQMAGMDYKKKRNKVNRVKTSYGDQLAVQTLDAYDDVAEIEQVFKGWAERARSNWEEAEVEYTALQRAIRHMKELNVFITIVRLDDAICGFSINEVLSNGYAICHFEKTMCSHQDMDSYLSNVVAKELLARGCRKMNWEQDLELPGLRQSKMTWRPSSFLKKYTIMRA